MCESTFWKIAPPATMPKLFAKWRTKIQNARAYASFKNGAGIGNCDEIRRMPNLTPSGIWNLMYVFAGLLVLGAQNREQPEPN